MSFWRTKNSKKITSDSIAVKTDGTTLKDYLTSKELETISISFNNTYVYSNNVDYICFKVGELCVLHIRSIAFKSSIPHNTDLITGLPIGSGCVIPCYGFLQAKGDTGRLNYYSGKIRTWYGSPSYYGDPDNKVYSLLCIFIVN